MLKAVLRKMIQKLPNGTVVPIVTGPLKGLKWSKHGKFIGYITGGYERDIMPLFASLIQPGQTVYDIGSHHGVYAIMSARLVGPDGAVVAVEPHPESTAQIRRNREINNFLGRLTICEAAISGVPGKAHFYTVQQSGTTGSLIGKIAGTRGHDQVDYNELDKVITVETMTIDGISRLYGWPDLIKLDVEGAESMALEGASAILRQGCNWFVSLHNSDEAKKCKKIFQDYGYYWRSFGLPHRDTMVATKLIPVLWHLDHQGGHDRDLYVV